MFNSQQIQLLKNTKEKELILLNEERLNYYGILSEYQLHPQNLVQNFSYRKLNPYQP